MQIGHAKQFEELVEGWFTEKGVRFMNEEELQNQCAPMTPTPDLLLTDDVVINGRPVAWVEVKSYYGTDLPSGF